MNNSRNNRIRNLFTNGRCRKIIRSRKKKKRVNKLSIRARVLGVSLNVLQKVNKIWTSYFYVMLFQT